MQLIQNRNSIYLQLLERKLKNFEYLEKEDIITDTYLEKEDIIKHSDKYTIDDTTKNETIKLKNFIQNNLQYDKIIQYNYTFNIFSDQKLFVDQELVDLNKIIKIQYLGIAQYELISECINEYNNSEELKLHDFINCIGNGYLANLGISTQCIFFFKVLDTITEKYIFYYDCKFYKTDSIIKLNYIPIKNHTLSLEIKNLVEDDYFKTYYENIPFLPDKYMHYFNLHGRYKKYFRILLDNSNKFVWINVEIDMLENPKIYKRVVDIKSARK
ncbi:hypothetical protein Hokovirus_2_46 [Hokovirus HKV1]|uniref:Uncharacterized protein n=1 Tax=Hokovirus HKV1 TaxID=1977638 RepID=A0A1V0SFM1_9VIRU|nr:hypothetical protein Hokovirus_2_46 [Hokovirus HKV1]